MATLQELQTQRDELLKQLSAAASVSIEGRSVTQKPGREVESALNRIDAEIARLSSSDSSRVFVVQSSRGLGE